MSRILLAGESWSITSIHTKGLDSYIRTSYEQGCDPFIAAMERGGHQIEYQPNHVAVNYFPETIQELTNFDLVILSDIGANTLLLPDKVVAEGRSSPNRIQVLCDWVESGGAVLMVGGYLSFQGIEGKANYKGTALADALPVALEAGDDRIEAPEGIRPRTIRGHPVTAGITEEYLPTIFGYHRFTAKPGSHVGVTTESDLPILVVGNYGDGKTAAFGTDMGPHWLSKEFLDSEAFDHLWLSLVSWLTDGSSSVAGQNRDGAT